MSQDKTYDIEDGAGEYTEAVIGRLFREDFDAASVIETLKSSDIYRTFDKGLTEAIITAGYTGDTESIADKTTYLINAVTEAGGSVSRPTVNDWFRGKRRPKCNAEGREKVFLLCFALKMTLEQTYNFFLKVFFDQPFNFRNSDECIYYYCLSKGLLWKDASDMKVKLDKMRAEQDTEAAFSGETVLIRSRLDKLETSDELLAYLVNNIPDETVYYTTARQYITALREEALELAKREIDSYDLGHTKYRSSKSTDYLLFVIYDIPAMGKFFKNNKIPEVVRKNFPGKMEFSMALSGNENVTSDLMRKCLILLMFYITFAKIALDKHMDNDYFDRFFSETSSVLDDCGFAPLYPANPYDWIFLSCAADSADEKWKSLNNFRNFIAEIDDRKE